MSELGSLGVTRPGAYACLRPGRRVLQVAKAHELGSLGVTRPGAYACLRPGCLMLQVAKVSNPAGPRLHTEVRVTDSPYDRSTGILWQTTPKQCPGI